MTVPPDGAPSLDAVDEVPVWLEVNGQPAVTWMCTPDQLPELVVGWCFGEGYIDSKADLLSMRPCAKEPGFWVTVPAARYETVEGQERRRVLASGCGAVTTILGSLSNVPRRTTRPPVPDLARTRLLFKELFARGERYATTGGIHAAALTDGEALLAHAEDIGRHNAVDKVLGQRLLAGRTAGRPDPPRDGPHLRRARVQSGARAHRGGGDAERAQHHRRGDRAGRGDGAGGARGLGAAAGLDGMRVCA
jgi:FdhD protein